MQGATFLASLVPPLSPIQRQKKWKKSQKRYKKTNAKANKMKKIERYQSACFNIQKKHVRSNTNKKTCTKKSYTKVKIQRRIDNCVCIAAHLIGFSFPKYDFLYFIKKIKLQLWKFWNWVCRNLDFELWITNAVVKWQNQNILNCDLRMQSSGKL